VDVQWLRGSWAGNPLWAWGAAALAMLASLGILLAGRRVLGRRAVAWARGSSLGLVRIIGATLARTHGVFLIALAVLIASLFLDLGARTVVLRRLVVLATLVQGGLWARAALDAALDYWKERRTGNGSVAGAVVALGFLGQVAVWAVVLLLALDNFDVKVTALLAGLGVGGVAMALAVQNILGDLFASVSIVLDKPFEVGDFILVGDMMGAVEYIGMKTTRVRSLSGEQIIFSNADLLGSRIRNFKRMRERRVTFTLNVSYDTPHDRLARLPERLREIVGRKPKVRLDRAHFQRFDESALVFEVVYYVTDPDYNLFMDLQQEINLEIFRTFEEEDIRFAHPARVVRLERAPHRTSAAAPVGPLHASDQ
jgi:small-conductance mechanosensitive channel